MNIKQLKALSVKTHKLFKLLNAVGKQITSTNVKREKSLRENTASVYLKQKKTMEIVTRLQVPYVCKNVRYLALNTANCNTCCPAFCPNGKMELLLF